MTPAPNSVEPAVWPVSLETGPEGRAFDVQPFLRRLGDRAALAERVGVSPRQLERLFRRYLGSTPTRHYLELRLQHARSLLAQTSMSILDVALACGFTSASHFSKCHRELFGMKPRETRTPPAAALNGGRRK